jgi:putative hydrolase of the HAD superfamily
LPELEAELAPSGMSVGMFHPTLRFLSFEHGFSKPDPHVFRFFSARLRTLDINVEETVVVGDRYNNDIEPAAAQGFQTWQLSTEPAKSENSGNWKQLGEFLSNS